MRLSHLILAHANPVQLERLIKRLSHSKADVYIHLDAKTDINEFQYLKAISGVIFIKKRISILWGNYSMIEATLRSFEEILQSGTVYSHINLLSGNDYPLKSAQEIQPFLFANADKTFMRFLAIPEEWDESLSRLQKYNFGDFIIPGKHYLQTLANKFLPIRKIPNHLKIYGRSQWFTITPECAAYVIRYIKDNPPVKRFFLMTWAADELIFQTILLNSPLRESVYNDHLRYIKFKKGDSRPQVLTMKDAQVLVESGKFYARKFDPSTDDAILDYLDSLAHENFPVS